MGVSSGGLPVRRAGRVRAGGLGQDLFDRGQLTSVESVQIVDDVVDVAHHRGLGRGGVASENGCDDARMIVATVTARLTANADEDFGDGGLGEDEIERRLEDATLRDAGDEQVEVPVLEDGVASPGALALVLIE
jgi:hypothetical protein